MAPKCSYLERLRTLGLCTTEALLDSTRTPFISKASGNQSLSATLEWNNHAISVDGAQGAKRFTSSESENSDAIDVCRPPEFKLNSLSTDQAAHSTDGKMALEEQSLHEFDDIVHVDDHSKKRAKLFYVSSKHPKRFRSRPCINAGLQYVDEAINHVQDKTVVNNGRGRIPENEKVGSLVEKHGLSQYTGPERCSYSINVALSPIADEDEDISQIDDPGLSFATSSKNNATNGTILTVNHELHISKPFGALSNEPITEVQKSSNLEDFLYGTSSGKSVHPGEKTIYPSDALPKRDFSSTVQPKSFTRNNQILDALFPTSLCGDLSSSLVIWDYSYGNSTTGSRTLCQRYKNIARRRKSQFAYELSKS